MLSSMTDAVALSPNYQWGRYGKSVKYLVLHTTQGAGLGSLNWIRNPDSQVSYHYLIMEDGEIVGVVHEEHSAWHAGAISGTPVTDVYTGVNPNYESIGIALAGYAATPIGPQQARAAGALVREIWSRYGELPVVQHAWLSPGNRTDPGEFNYNWVMTEAEEGMYDEEKVKGTIRAMLTTAEGANLVEFAVSRPGGFADKLEVNLVQGVRDAIRKTKAEAMES